MTEKLLITLLTKLSNFVPEGGIWMNTQRPEWNDANNALVGRGLSMVTVYHIYRYLDFIISFYRQVDLEEFSLSIELEPFFRSIHQVFNEHLQALSTKLSNEERKTITDKLGLAGEQYRHRVYDLNAAKTIKISSKDLLRFLKVSKQFIEHTINANLRDDQLYHSNNLIELQNDGFGIKNLYVMLEGQVAVLGSGYLEAESSLKLINSLRMSALYREYQGSYVLYPDKELPTFLQKARIPKELIQKSALLLTLIKKDDKRIVYNDLNNECYFSSALCNVNDLKLALEQLEPDEYGKLMEADRHTVLDIFEEVFHHHEFTGRSGTFFGYEGLGSIYWHMNSKLLLAIQETYYKANQAGRKEEVANKLKAYYYEVKNGLGTLKNPLEYGAFPTDPYSHTPANKGAQQPGMTGQVKEDIISRIGELGVAVNDGCIEFSNNLLNQAEYLSIPGEFVFWSLSGTQKSFLIDNDCLVFTLCQTPIIYSNSGESYIEVLFDDESVEKVIGTKLSAALSQQVFERSGEIEKF